MIKIKKQCLTKFTQSFLYVIDAVVFSILTHLIITTALDKVLSLLHFVDMKSEVYTGQVICLIWGKSNNNDKDNGRVDAGSLLNHARGCKVVFLVPPVVAVGTKWVTGMERWDVLEAPGQSWIIVRTGDSN